MAAKEEAARLLRAWKGDRYSFGNGVLGCAADYAAACGRQALVVANSGPWLAPTVARVLTDLAAKGVELAGGRAWPSARPNAPREDVYRIECSILRHNPDCIIALGGGSSIDAVKAANVLAALGGTEPDIDAYFGVGQVTSMLERTGEKLKPLVAVQTASGSAAHLTKYSNVTDPAAGQKKLIVDDAIVPAGAVFDYSVTASAPLELTVDGALDSIAHSLEVYYGISGEGVDLARRIAVLTIELVLEFAPKAVAQPHDLAAREGLGLAADLGGYAIMVGGTNGGHLTSFSLVDVTSHGRACAVMNPYYTLFFAPAIEDKVRAVGDVYREAGLITENLAALHGRALGEAVAGGMVAFAKAIGMPTTLAELPSFSDAHIERALTAAKNPQLAMKLKNMPVPLDASLIDDYMRPILQAATTGDFSLIKTLA